MEEEGTEAEEIEQQEIIRRSIRSGRRIRGISRINRSSRISRINGRSRLTRCIKKEL